MGIQPILLASSVTTAVGNRTATATPTLNDFIVIFQGYTGNATGPAVISDNNADGQGSNYGFFGNALKNASADRMEMWIRNTPIRSATSTIWTSTQPTNTGGFLLVFRIAIKDFPSANQMVVQSGFQSNGSAAGTPTITLGATTLQGSGLIGVIFNGTNPAATAAPSGWNSSLGFGYATPAAGVGYTTASDNGLARTPTVSTVTWSGTSASAFCAGMVEIAAVVPRTGGINYSSNISF